MWSAFPVWPGLPPEQSQSRTVDGQRGPAAVSEQGNLGCFAQAGDPDEPGKSSQIKWSHTKMNERIETNEKESQYFALHSHHVAPLTYSLITHHLTSVHSITSPTHSPTINNQLVIRNRSNESSIFFLFSSVTFLQDPTMSFRRIMRKANTLTAVLWSSVLLVVLSLVRARIRL